MARLALVALLCTALAPALPAHAVEAGDSLADDPALAALVAEALAARPELAAAESALRAERARIPEVSAFPDPVLSLGIQNDGFGELMIGEMETSFWSLGLSQTIPFPGKRGLRAGAAAEGARGAEAALSRARLTAEADVRRAYLDLVLVRERLALLARLELLWQKSEGTVRSRYEAGEGSQTDLLRAQLERTRLRQRRIALQAEERSRIAAVNRLRGKPAGEPVETRASLAALADPALPEREAALADAEARSPELAQARADASRAEREAALARRDRFPDVTVSAAVMPRGQLDPMWSAGLSVPLPLLGGRSRAAEERGIRATAARSSVEAALQVVRLRAVERHEALGAARDTLALYRGGLLVQSRATAESAISQYRVGRVPFAATLEAIAGNVADEEAFLAAVADAQRLWIASVEVSTAETLPGAPGGGGAMPGTSGGGAAGPRPPAGGPGGGAPAGGGSSPTPGMGGM